MSFDSALKIAEEAGIPQPEGEFYTIGVYISKWPTNEAEGDDWKPSAKYVAKEIEAQLRHKDCFGGWTVSWVQHG